MMRPLATLLALAGLAGSAAAQPYGIGAPTTEGVETVSRVPELVAPTDGGRVYERDGVWYIRAVPGDTPDTLARDAYGNPELWFLLVHQNQERLEGRTPGEGEPLELVIPPPPRHRVMRVGDEVLLRAIPGDTLRGIASDIYGDPEAWRRIVEANRGLPDDPEAPLTLAEGARMNLLVLPIPPTSDRPNGPGAGTVPGSVARAPQPSGIPTTGGGGTGGYRPPTTTSRGGSASSYGQRSPRTGAGVIDWGQAMGGAGDPVVRSPSGGTSSTHGGTTYGGGTQVASGPAPRPSASQAAAAPLPGGISALNIRSARDIGPQEAATILAATGFTHSRIVNKHTPPARNEMEAGLMALKWGNTYSRPRQRVALDGQSQEWLFEAYKQLQEAHEKYRGWPDISRRSNPEAYERWVVGASSQLTNVPQHQRVALMRSLMQTETGQTHWNDYKPVVSWAGAVGYGQFLPATASDLGINPYDPQQNIEGIARYVNKLIGQSNGSVREALARYNGGNNPPSSSYGYADGILSRVA